MAALAAVGSFLVTAVSAYAAVAGAVGVAAVVAGLSAGSRPVFSVGVAVLFGGVVAAGVVGLPPAFLLLAAFLTVVAWDAGRTGFGIAAEIGRETPTRRIEVVQLASSAVALVAGASVGYAVFRSTTSGGPVVALVALLVGVGFLLISIVE